MKTCLIIPVYNHHLKLNVLIDSLRTLNLTCFLLDDGSDIECMKALRVLSELEPWIELVRFDLNRGKGAVVCDGLRLAVKKGFSHALQVDADGQHVLADIPQFLAMSQRCPEAVVCGARPYQAMPSSRRYGRLVTDFWVWVNTLSLSIKDSMCGFRLYPLQHTVKTLDHFTIGQRMDFDTDLLVKLYWDGLDLVHINTDVVYQDEIISHFDILCDNARISKMHAKHFVGMLMRSPELLTRHRRRKAPSAQR